MLAHRLDTALAVARLSVLGGDAVLAFWPVPRDHGGRISVRSGDSAVRGPVTIVVLPTSEGGARAVAALRRPAVAPEARPLAFAGPAGEVLAEARAAPEPFDPAPLLAGLDAAARVRLVRLVAETCAGLFRLGADPVFVAACRALIGAVCGRPVRLVPRLALTPRLVVAAAALPAAVRRPDQALTVGAGGVRRNPFPPAPPAPGDEAMLLLAFDRTVAGPGTLVVLLGEAGAACAAVAPAGPIPPAADWLARNQGAPPATREYLMASLTRAAASDPAAVAALRELALCRPLPRRTACVPGRPVGGDVEAAVPDGTGGLFVAGWLYDPHDLIAGMTAVSPTGARLPLDIPQHRFPRPDIATRYGATPEGERLGFLAYCPGAGPGALPAGQYRFELGLASGARLAVTAPPPAADPAAARAAVLSSVSAAHLTPEALADCIAPPAAALHAAYMATKRPPEEIRLGAGPARPAVSIVIPLYRNLAFLRFQAAAFATDPDMARAEILYVLDSPEQALAVDSALATLHGLYGLPFRLLVMSGNYGFAAACNAGAAAARASTVLFLNSDVVPDRPGWLAALRRALARGRRAGAVGAKLLFDDDSLQHAGLYYWQDRRGRWINRHFYKGMPRRYPPAEVPRAVPGLTGACLLVRRRLFEDAGGFSEDYIIGDYEDSDLCLRLYAAGAALRYEPAAELYHLERRSIERHPGYTRGVASAYNGWLHARRWGAVMAGLAAWAPDAAAAREA